MESGLEIKLFGKNVTDEIVGSSSLALPLTPGSFFKLWEPGKQFGISIRKTSLMIALNNALPLCCIS